MLNLRTFVQLWPSKASRTGPQNPPAGAFLVKILVATGQLIGESFDCRELSTPFLATPIKFGGRLLQYLGRVLRPAPGKDKAKVYDYVDKEVGVLRAAGEARRRVYAL
jgi:superfamily II DNA or RNA helicase